jgi:hypothetical protein
VLATVNVGEGYWVNVLDPMTLPGHTGTSFTWNQAGFAALGAGFNLIATADALTPSQFHAQVSVTPPAFVSLWAWDATAAKWYFHSPLLESSGGLPAVKAYADSHNYLHFQDYGMQIGIGVGFWVNKP